MRSINLRRRGAVLRNAKRYSWIAPALAALLLAGGCDRTAERDLAVKPGQGAGSPGILDTVPDAPASLSEAGQDPSLDAPPKKLGIGDPSPGLKIAKWVKGDPVDETLTSKVHVVEFWATWCGPCRVGMPHISSLQKEYGDQVAFVGITREQESTVTEFLEAKSPSGKTWDEVIQYRLAIDDGDWTNSAYMRAAGQNGIPCAFVVGRDGVVEWIGHPGRIDEPLEKIVNGSWDREAAIAEFKQQERLKELSTQISLLTRSRDWDGALEMLDQLEGEVGKSKGLSSYRLRILESAGRTDEASAVRKQVVEDAWDDANALNEIAWNTATSGDSADLELALKAARRASELRDDQDAAVLDTVARCFYELGQLDEAIKWQRLAVEHNEGHREIDVTLKNYLAEKSQAEESQPAKVEPAKVEPVKVEPVKEADSKEKPAKEEPAKEAAPVDDESADKEPAKTP